MPPTSTLSVMIVGSTAIDIVVGLMLLGWRVRVGSAALGLLELGIVALITSAAFGLKLLILRLFGLDSFGMIHLIYLALVVTMPGLGIALLALGIFERRRGRGLRPASVAAAVATLAVCGAGVYATFVEPFCLQLTRAELALPPPRAGSSDFTIGVLSDLQASGIGDYENRAIETLVALRPDLILIPGDVFQGSDTEFERWLPALHQLFGKLDAPAGVFLVPGDVDQSLGRLEHLVEGTRVRLLRNNVARIAFKDRRIVLAGLELDVWSDAAKALVADLKYDMDQRDICIVLSHRPDSVLAMEADSRVDLVVAGHTHGGQVCVPGFGPLLTLTHVPRNVAAGGLHRIHGNAIFVSRGVGCERGQAPRIRFFCPPEVALVRLTSRAAADKTDTFSTEAQDVQTHIDRQPR